MKASEYVATVNEHALQKAVVQYLELRCKQDVTWFAIPNAGKRGPKVARLMKEEGMRAGVADLCIMLPEGRVAWLELKTTTGKQRAEQKAFELVCTALDHPYRLARNLEEVIGFLKEVGATK